MQRALKKITVCMILCILFAMPVFGVWKQVSDGDAFHEKNSFLKFSVVQVQISDLDLEAQTIEVRIFNRNGDFQEKVQLGLNEEHVWDDQVRITPVEFQEERGRKEVQLRVDYRVGLEVLDHVFPQELEIGKLYKLEVEVFSHSTEAEKFELDVIPSAPFLRSATTRIVTRVNPQAETKLYIDIEPREAVTDGSAVLNILYEDEVLESIEINSISIKDFSTGYLNDLVMPRVLRKGETYVNKAKVSLTNDAESSSKMRVVFKSEDIQFDTDSKFGTDVLAENIGPHVTKELFLSSFTPLRTGETDIVVELYANGRIVDKLVKTVIVEGFGESAPVEEEEEEVQPAVEPVPEPSIEESVEEPVVEATPEEVPIEKEPVVEDPLPTAHVVAETEAEESHTLARILQIGLLILLGTVVYHRFFKPPVVTEKQMKQLERSIRKASVRERKKKTKRKK